MEDLIPHEMAQPHNPVHTPMSTPSLSSDPSPKKRNWLLIAGIAVVAFIVFVFLIISCAWSLGGPAIKAGEDFLKQITAGQVDLAYESAAIQFKQTVPKEAFTAFLKDYPIATKVRSVVISSFAIENNFANLQGTVTGTDGQVSPVNMRLVNENNAWRVLYVDFLTPEQQAAMQQAAQQQANQQQVPQGTQQSGQPVNPQPVTGEAQQPSTPSPVPVE